jgi:hypothetical protein
MNRIASFVHSVPVALAIGAVIYFTFFGFERADGDITGPT